MGKALFDKFSLLHMSVGVICNFLRMPWWLLLILHTIFEMLENYKPVRKFIHEKIALWPGRKPEPDTLTNIVGDTISVMVGWLIAYSLNIEFDLKDRK